MYTTDLSLAQQALRQEDKHHIEHLAIALGMHYPTNTPVRMTAIADLLGRLHSDQTKVITVQQVLMSWLGVKLVSTKKLHAVARAYWTAVSLGAWSLYAGGDDNLRARIRSRLPGTHPVDVEALRGIITDCAYHIKASGLVVGHQHACPYWGDQRLAEMALLIGDDNTPPDLARLAVLSTPLLKRLRRADITAIERALKEQMRVTAGTKITATA
jgi:hypothetical protein